LTILTLDGMPTVLHVPAFEDNYIWLIPGNDPRRVAIVDPGDAEPVLARLERDGLIPAAIVITHHHGDHAGGIADLAARYPIPVYGPARENIPGVTHALGDGDRVRLESLGREFEVLAVPGHTTGHIAYYGHGWLFCGDTLFSAGCGRLFEGTAEQMHASLARLKRLPDATEVYCAHEYTAANLRFALTVEPGNGDAQRHRDTVRQWREADRPSLPSTIGLEKRINPFLRAHEPAVRAAAERQSGQRLDNEVEVFAAVRRWKDTFR
jgi:hydroxyacylglutathione hydrolase